jgi:hypothetical protein
MCVCISLSLSLSRSDGKRTVVVSKNMKNESNKTKTEKVCLLSFQWSEVLHLVPFLALTFPAHTQKKALDNEENVPFENHEIDHFTDDR